MYAIRSYYGLDDPSGKSDDEFKITIQTIEDKMKDLIERLPSLL